MGYFYLPQNFGNFSPYVPRLRSKFPLIAYHCIYSWTVRQALGKSTDQFIHPSHLGETQIQNINTASKQICNFAHKQIHKTLTFIDT